MSDVQAVSVAVASASVVAGVLYYAFQIRHSGRMRHLDLFMRFYSIWGRDEMLDSHRRLVAFKVKDLDEFESKYGPIASLDIEASRILMDIDRIGWFFNLMGFLVKEKIVKTEMIDELLGYWVVKYWEIIKPLVLGWRIKYDIPDSYKWFEYLYDQMKRREKARATNT